MRDRRYRKQSGVTLIELLVTIGVVGVLMLIAVPSFQSYIGTQRLRSASSDIVAALNIARSEAVKRNTDITIEVADSDWEDGWTVYVTSGGATIREFAAVTGVSYSVENDGGTAITSLEYGSNGRLTGGNGASFEVNNDPAVSGVSARCVEISLSGKPSTDKGSC